MVGFADHQVEQAGLVGGQWCAGAHGNTLAASLSKSWSALSSAATSLRASFPALPPAISARTDLADQLLRTWIEDRGARRKSKCLKIGEGLPVTLVAIAAIGRSKLPPTRLNECGRCGPPGIGGRDRSLTQLEGFLAWAAGTADEISQSILALPDSQATRLPWRAACLQ